jgi:SNF2 family DNA or RNA helicase
MDVSNLMRREQRRGPIEARRPDYPLKVDAGYGRLFVSGRLAGHQSPAARLPGAAWNEKRHAIELALTLDMMRKIKTAYGLTGAQFVGFCTPAVQAWGNAAQRSEEHVRTTHERLQSGYRTLLPWHDNEGAPPRPPFEHQQVLATAATMLDGCAFLCEMGTAKTRPAIEAATHLLRNESLDAVVVVAPANVLAKWGRELRRWAAPGTEFHVLTGTVAERKHAMHYAMRQPGARPIFVINYEVLARMRIDIEAIGRTKRVGLILDEMHKVRNPTAKTTKAAMALAQTVRWRMGLTGTLILNGIPNVWSQWYCIDLGVTFGANFVQFRRQYFTEDEYTHRVDPLAGTASAVGERIRRRGLVYKKADCLDLPPKLMEQVEVEMTKEQTRAYAQMAHELVVRLRDMDNDPRTASATIQLTMMLRLSQITSGFLPIDADGEEPATRHVFTPNPKMDACIELATELAAARKQFIIWARYRWDLAELEARLKAHGLRVGSYHGGTPRSLRSQYEEAFQRGELDVLVAHPASGGLGLTLTNASHALYYSQDYSLENRAQSEDRCHRPGSEKHESVTYVDFICKGTIDAAVLAALRAKQDTATAVMEFRNILEGT